MPCLDIELVGTFINTRVASVNIVKYPRISLRLCLQCQTRSRRHDGNVIGNILPKLRLDHPNNLHVGYHLVQALTDGTGIVRILTPERGKENAFLLPRTSDVAKVHVPLSYILLNNCFHIHIYICLLFLVTSAIVYNLISIFAENLLVSEHVCTIGESAKIIFYEYGFPIFIQRDIKSY